MLGLPISTELNKTLPKSQLYKKFDLRASQQASFDKDVASMAIVNALMPQTLPAIAEGKEVKAIFVIEVELKRKDFDHKSIGLIARLIPQRIVFALRFEDKVMLAVYHDKLFTAQWQAVESATLPLSGLTLDAVWENIVCQLSDINSSLLTPNSSLSDVIRQNDSRAKLERQIAALEKQMRSTTQTHRQRELYSQIKKLKGGLR